MAVSTRQLLDAAVAGTDGELGVLADLLADEQTWQVHFAVLAAGPWLLRRRVLIPAPLLSVSGRRIEARLTREDMRRSPDPSTAPTVQLEAELLLAKYWHWVPRWAGRLPEETARVVATEASRRGKRKAEELVTSHLRSLRELQGYRVRGRDGRIGAMLALRVTLPEWRVGELRVRGGRLFRRHRLALPVATIERVRWSDGEILVRLSTAEAGRLAAGGGESDALDAAS